MQQEDLARFLLHGPGQQQPSFDMSKCLGDRLEHFDEASPFHYFRDVLFHVGLSSLEQPSRLPTSFLDLLDPIRKAV